MFCTTCGNGTPQKGITNIHMHKQNYGSYVKIFMHLADAIIQSNFRKNTAGTQQFVKESIILVIYNAKFVRHQV